jgi:hypothetical protein
MVHCLGFKSLALVTDTRLDGEAEDRRGAVWLVRLRGKKSPRDVAVALIAPDVWSIRADFNDGLLDYRCPDGGPLKEMPGGFDSSPPSPDVTEREQEIVHEMRLRQSGEEGASALRDGQGTAFWDRKRKTRLARK